MKLLTKTTLYFLLAMIPLLAGGGYLLFRQFSREIDHRVDRELVYDEIQWVQYVEAVTADGSSFILRAPDLLIFPVDERPSRYPSISTTQGQKARDNIRIPFRQLSHVVAINGVPYQIVIRKSQEQKAVLVANITTIMLLVFVGLGLATLLFNWIISKRLWRPFRASLQKIRHIELQQMDEVRFEETATTEFNELNTSLNAMTRKLHSDYLVIKEFTENAAHEMQTPLAIAQTKMELLLQDEALTGPQVDTILQATDALGRLGKLNQSLLLLARIEASQYETTDTLNLVDVTRKYLDLFAEMIQDRQITVETEFVGDFTVKLHPVLADSLVSNLLGNAVKYNRTGGRITIAVSERRYCISNTSDTPAIPPQQLFKRFGVPAAAPGHSTGLGLAIVKRIADTHHLYIAYAFEKDMHRFCIEAPGT
ncbi:MAG TPA: ATP-binding protein [Chitinophagaceae bacterium]